MRSTPNNTGSCHKENHDHQKKWCKIKFISNIDYHYIISDSDSPLLVSSISCNILLVLHPQSDNLQIIDLIILSLLRACHPPVIQAKNVEDITMVLNFIPLICRVKCFWPRKRVAKDTQPVLRPIRQDLKQQWSWSHELYWTNNNTWRHTPHADLSISRLI